MLVRDEVGRDLVVPVAPFGAAQMEFGLRDVIPRIKLRLAGALPVGVGIAHITQSALGGLVIAVTQQLQGEHRRAGHVGLAAGVGRRVRKASVFLLMLDQEVGGPVHAFAQVGVVGAGAVGRLEGLHAKGRERNVPLLVPVGAIIGIHLPAAMLVMLLAVQEHLDRPLHAGFDRGNAGQGIGLADGIGRDGMGIGFGAAREGRRDKPALVVLARHQIADGLFDRLTIFFRSGGFAMRQIGQQRQAGKPFLVRRVGAPRAVGILVDPQPLQGAQDRGLGIFAPFAAIGADGGLAAFPGSVHHVAGGETFEDQRAEGVGGDFQVGRRHINLGRGEFLNVRRRGQIHVHVRRGDGVRQFGHFVGRLEILQLREVNILDLDHLDLDFGRRLLGGGAYEQEQEEDKNDMDDNGARGTSQPFEYIFI